MSKKTKMILMLVMVCLFTIPSLTSAESRDLRPEQEATEDRCLKNCFTDLTIDYYYDEDCNLHILIINTGTVEVTIGGKGNVNIIGVVTDEGVAGVIGAGNSPALLAPGQVYEKVIPAHIAANWASISVDPNNTITEQNEEGNNSIYLYDCDECSTGDVNSDGELTEADVALIDAYVRGGDLTPGQLQRADVDGDGDVDSDDAWALSEHIIAGTSPCDDDNDDYFFTDRVCHAAVDPYLGSYKNGYLKAQMCLEVTVEGDQATVSGYGENSGRGNIPAPTINTNTAITCWVRQNGVNLFPATSLGGTWATWDFTLDLTPTTVDHQEGDEYTLNCDHEWSTPEAGIILLQPAQITIIPN